MDIQFCVNAHCWIVTENPCVSNTSLPYNEIQSHITELAGTSPETPGQEEGEEIENAVMRRHILTTNTELTSISLKGIKSIQDHYNHNIPGKDRCIFKRVQE